MDLVAKLNPAITQGYRKKEDEFEFNKDAGMYVCKAGHMAIGKHVKERKKSLRTKQIPIILTWKNVKFVRSEKAVTNLKLKARVIP
ncbi:hypothetical protein SAMN05421787_1148 [Virgibacillus pantothenticus]|nr:hypothetical protein SAMN05421787_1148 [Virgibacillus pantothenticus]